MANIKGLSIKGDFTNFRDMMYPIGSIYMSVSSLQPYITCYMWKRTA